ncbi:MAG: acetate--CoA ligase [bacterium]
MDKKSIENIFSEDRLFPPKDSFSSQSHFPDFEVYRRKYEQSTQDPEKFWGEIAEGFEWFQKWKTVRRYDWNDKIETAWFEGGKLNLCVNALDRHLESRGDQTALLWVGNEPFESEKFTYRELQEGVCRLANALKELGVKKGDRVAIYMGMVPELFMGLLACARIGAVHNVVFGGFSAESLKERIQDCGAEVLLTADGLFRGAKSVSLKIHADRAMAECERDGHVVRRCLVLQRTGEKVEMKEGRDEWWHETVPRQVPECAPEEMHAEAPLFLLYTSGSTGKPKGVMHTTAGYMVQTATTFRYVFDIRERDVFWCTADVGWVTGHSYLVYGPLLNGSTTVMFEGVPTYPEPDRFWDIIEKYRVNILYTAPTALRALMREGDGWVTRHDLSSLKLLGTVGEPINPEAWVWYYEVVGKERCPIVDTWWQTETGAIMVTPLPGAMSLKPGSAGFPFFGVKAKVIREDGTECGPEEGGYFVIEEPWPSMIRGVYGQPERVKETYFSKFPGRYFAGDGARRDKDGYVWFLGRVDDVLNVSGHRIGTAELESAFVKCPKVAEAAVVGFPHEVKGQGIYAFVTLKKEAEAEGPLENELKNHIRNEIGPIAVPDRIQITPALPKTRSGKIMRRILRKIAEGDTENLGDTSTLADPAVVEELVKGAETAPKNEKKS